MRFFVPEFTPVNEELGTKNDICQKFVVNKFQKLFQNWTTDYEIQYSKEKYYQFLTLGILMTHVRISTFNFR